MAFRYQALNCPFKQIHETYLFFTFLKIKMWEDPKQYILNIFEIYIKSFCTNAFLSYTCPKLNSFKYIGT